MLSLFSTEGGDNGGGRQRVLALLLLVIVAGFCYLYFFTNMIISHEKPAPPPPPPAPVKQPIPPRPDQAALPKEAAAPAKEAAAPAVVAKPAEKPGEKAPATPTAPQVAGQPSQAKPAQPAAKVEVAKPVTPPAKPAATQPQDVKKPAAVKTEPAKPASAPAKPAASQAQGVKTPKGGTDKKTVPSAKGAAKPVVKGNFALLVGEYPRDESLQKVRTQLKRQGIKPVQETQVKSVRKMNRLFVAEFGDRAAAEAEQAKLAKLTSDSFIMREEGSFRVYAGSYLMEKRVAAEKTRLAQKGVAVSVQKIDLPIVTIRVTAGKFASKSDADAAAGKLRKSGIPAKVLASGKQK